MKATRLIILGIVLLLACGLAACGPSAAERAAHETERLELEKQAQRDVQKANTTIANMSKKLGRKPPELDLGVATETKTQSAPGQPKQP